MKAKLMNKQTPDSRILSRPGRRRRPRPAAGSAYLVTLLALVVMTMLALSLSLVTQSELLIGSNERTIQRVFYAADSGVAIATANALVAADYSSKTIAFPEPDSLLGVEYEVELSAFFPLLNAPCNLCQINDAGQYGTKQYFKNDYAVTSVATRKDAADTAVLAQRAVRAVVEIQPQDLSVSAMEALGDPTEVSKIKL